MQLSALSLALTRAFGSGFSWRTLFADGTPGTRLWIEEAYRANQAAMGPELIQGGYFTPVGYDNVTTQTSATSFSTTGVATPSCVAVPVVASGAANKTYIISFRVTQAPASGNLQAYTRTQLDGGGSSTAMSASITTPGVYSFQATTSVNVMSLLFATSANGSNYAVDRISVREIDVSRCQLFQDSAGTLPVTAMGQPIGLILDPSRGNTVFGSELCADGAFNSQGAWLLDNGAAISGGQLSLPTVSVSRAQYPIQTTAGRVYRVTATASANTFCGAWSAVNQVAQLNDLAGYASASSRSGAIAFTFRATGSVSYIAFTSTAATTPIIDNVSVVELPAGNHAVQPSNTASRPIMSRRVNLLTATEAFDDVIWIKTKALVTANAAQSPVGQMIADFVVEAAESGTHACTRINVVSTVAGSVWVVSVYAKPAGRSHLMIETSGTKQCIFDLTSATVTHSGSGVVGSAKAVGDGWVRCSATITPGVSASMYVEFKLCNGPAIGNEYYVGDGASGVYLWGADVRLPQDTINLPPYQRVTSATDYDEAGFPAFAESDGLDDWWETAALDLTGTDAVTVVAGVQKTTDATVGMILEMSVNINSNLRGVRLTAANPTNTYEFVSIGSSVSQALSPALYPSPSKVLLTGLGKISTDTSILRINGEQVASTAADQGAGNYGLHKLFFMRRAGASLPFRGRFYGCTIIGKQLTAAQLAALEAYDRNLGRLY